MQSCSLECIQKNCKLMGGHKWEKEVMVIDRKEDIFLFQVCLCPSTLSANKGVCADYSS